MKLYHHQRIKRKDFQVGDCVLLFNSRFKIFPGKLKLKWSGPFKMTRVFPSRVVELETKKEICSKITSKQSSNTLVQWIR